METWFIIISALCLSLLLKSLFDFLFAPKTFGKIPPGPPSYPVIGGLLWFRKSFAELEPILRDIRTKYGPIISINLGPQPAIFIASHSLTHQALVQNGAVFSDRPPALPTRRIITSNQHNISSAAYGPNWRLLRRNLTSEILHPSRIKSYSHARQWVLGILIDRLKCHAESGEIVMVRDHFQFAMFCLLVIMCFGDKLDENQIKEIETVQRALLLNLDKFRLLNFFPRLGKILFRKKWEQLMEIRRNQEDVLIPLIRARAKAKTEMESMKNCEMVTCYTDTLLELELPEEKRKLNEDEMVSLCSEFLNAGTDTTSTALQWILANLVKYPHIQSKLFEEIKGVVGEKSDEIREEDLQRLPYVKAVVLEGLRIHPPAHFVLPHRVTEDTVFDGYVIPRNGSVNFMVAEMGRDPQVWEDPMEFKPERFVGDDFDITGSREIKMMPFGAGRRICPGWGLAMLHLEYFVANLVWYFQWTAVDGDAVDLSEKQEFTMVMKTPLRAHITPRSRVTQVAHPTFFLVSMS